MSMSSNVATAPSRSPGTSAKPASRTGALEVIQLRNDFYRDGYRSAQTISVLLTIALLFSLGFNFYLASRPKPKPQYFSTSPAGTLTPMVPLDNPLLSMNQLNNWVVNAVTKAYTLDAKNYVKQIGENGRYFTAEGYEQYKQALVESQQLKLIKEKVMITSVTATGSPVVLDAMRTADGTLMWKMQVPLMVQYTSAKESLAQSVVASLVVTRVPTTESIDGVAISQIVARPGTR